MKLCNYNSKSNKKNRFKLISTPRYSSSITSFKITPKGWELSSSGLEGGEAKPNGKPYLYHYFDQDDVEYPSSLPEVLEELWRKAHIENFDDKRLGITLKKIARWIDDMNWSTPYFPLTKKAKAKQQKFQIENPPKRKGKLRLM